jgi:hypothetical protein
MGANTIDKAPRELVRIVANVRGKSCIGQLDVRMGRVERPQESPARSGIATLDVDGKISGYGARRNGKFGSTIGRRNWHLFDQIGRSDDSHGTHGEAHGLAVNRVDGLDRACLHLFLLRACSQMQGKGRVGSVGSHGEIVAPRFANSEGETVSNHLHPQSIGPDAGRWANEQTSGDTRRRLGR